MKFYTALVNKTLNDRRHSFSTIRLLIKRHRQNAAEPWTYTALVEYSYDFQDVKNHPISFESAQDWDAAAKEAFEKYLGWMDDVVIEFVQKVDF